MVGSSKAIRNWAAEEWGVTEGLKITQLSNTQFLFRFVSEDLAVKILNEGRMWFDNNFMHLERKVGDLYGGFVNVICSLHDLPSVRILVRKGGKVPVSIVAEDRVSGYRVWLSIEFRPSILQEDRKGNIESGRRKGGGFGSGRGRRVDLRRCLSGQTQNIDVPAIQRHPRRLDLGRRACDSHGSSLFTMGGQMKEVSGIPPPPADQNCCSGEKNPAGATLCEGCLGRITAAGVSGSSTDLVLAGCGGADAIEATPTQEIAPVLTGKAQLIPSDPEVFCSVEGRVRGSCSNSISDGPIGVGDAMHELQQINNFASGCEGIH
ncbi:hypothetical protein HAX54_014637 [Datura stramonium]|uniref:DUF4283 domain-containing protein n=1 Tax=Datura stramonium TaxID=4076 RepID=A0ABS8TQG4_DATST|nr:hypothetical protein [Datura stramonium]